MPAFVTIQALPARIIGNILRFLQYKQTAQSIRQLLQVCHQWRRVLFQLECSQYVVRVGTVIDKGYTLWPAELPQPDDHFFALVTTLNFTIDFNYIFNGKGVQKVSGIWCHQQIFPHVRHLNLLIQHNTSDEDILMHDYDSHAHVFAKFIKQLVPKAAALTVSYDAFTMVKEMPTDHSFNAMLTNLFRNMHYSAMLVNYNDFINSYQPEIAHSLSRLDCCWNERYEQVLPLIHNSSETLIELRLTCHGMSRDKLAHLFVSSYNHYIIYYNLEKLVFEKSANRDDAFKPSLQVCQFMPKLRYLYLGIVYPFADDLLFRGTMDTLEYLHLTPDVDMLQMLDKYQVFAKGNFKRLQHITIADNSQFGNDDSHRNGQLAAAVAQFVHRASSVIRVVDIQEAKAGEKLVCAMVHSMQMTSLKSLHINHSQLTFADLVPLLTALPQLTELHCMCAGMGDDYVGAPFLQLADYMYQNHYPLSTSFNHWEIVHNYHSPLISTESVKSMALCTLLLTVLCPAFTRAKISSIHKRQYNSYIKQAVTSSLATRYARQFRGLLQPV